LGQLLPGQTGQRAAEEGTVQHAVDLAGGSTFAECSAGTACFDGVLGSGADFTKAALTKSTFIKATVLTGRFVGCTAVNADFSLADVSTSDFSGTVMPQATFAARP